MFKRTEETYCVTYRDKLFEDKLYVTKALSFGVTKNL